MEQLDQKKLEKKFKTAKHSASDSANSVIRGILYQISLSLNGMLKNEHLFETLEAFTLENNLVCPYSGITLNYDFDFDHAIPMNKDKKGLHLFGNVIPCHPTFNRIKGNYSYDNFLDKLSGDGITTKCNLDSISNITGITITSLGKKKNLIKLEKYITDQNKEKIKDFLDRSGYYQISQKIEHLDLQETYIKITNLVTNYSYKL